MTKSMTLSRSRILILLVILLVCGAAAGFSVAWYGLLPADIRGVIHDWSRVVAFLPIWIVGIILFIQRFGWVMLMRSMVSSKRAGSISTTPAVQPAYSGSLRIWSSEDAGGTISPP